MQEAYIMAVGRSAVGKAPRGCLRYTRPDDLAAQVINGVLATVPDFKNDIEDLIMGCAFPEAEQGANVARIIATRAGLPATVCGQTVNRYCSSGIQSVANATFAIRCGAMNTVLAGGVESMSMVPMGGNNVYPNPVMITDAPGIYSTMGITAENVAEKYGVTRQMADEFSVSSHNKAAAARQSGKFAEEIIPVQALVPGCDEDGLPCTKTVTFAKDEGIREGATLDDMAKLKPVFKLDGVVTAGNSSQTSDGAAITLLMSDAAAKKYDMAPLGRLVSFAVAGVDPRYMGIGPIEAIPKALAQAGLSLNDIDLFELNEAFATQSLACMNTLGLDPAKVNPNGGAIALGHPLGCTGSFLLTKLFHELRRQNKKYGVVSMCIGGGMGAAGVVERF